MYDYYFRGGLEKTRNTFEDIRNKFAHDNEFEMIIEKANKADGRNCWM